MTAQPKDGGQAFPTHPILYSSADQHLAQGMSLRDWFAGQALAGLVQLRAIHEAARDAGEPAEALTAQAAYQYADAMLEARK